MSNLLQVPQSLLDSIGPEWREEFLKFVLGEEPSLEFMETVEWNEALGKAVDRWMELEADDAADLKRALADYYRSQLPPARPKSPSNH